MSVLVDKCQGRSWIWQLNPRCSRSSRAVPGMVWDLAGWLPHRSGHGSGSGPGQGLFPVDNLDAASLLWRARKCNSMDMGLLPFASGPENSSEHI